jgi:crotonobetainyl-CoA:carnitine CoA-transferase CaiB-like acyl-CoA transferase
VSTAGPATPPDSFEGEPEPLLPLAGVRVLEMGTYIAAPFAAGLLSELGADVIKLEQPATGDPMRQLGEAVNGRTIFWALEGRGRRSVTCNLRDARGQNLALRLVAQSDVVIENFRPGTLERWNLGYERLRDVNPRVILLRISAFGQTGPYASRPGFGRIGQAFGGLTYLAGEPGRPPVLPGSAMLADYATGLFGTVAVLAALRACDASGQGQVVDVSLYESILRFTDRMAPVYDALGIVRERSGSAGIGVPHDHYPTGDAKWVAVACTNDRMFQRLANAMGDAAWATDPDYATLDRRLERRGEIDARVAEWTARFTQTELCDALDRAEVPNSPIYSIADCFADSHYAARGTFVSTDDPIVGPVAMPAPVARLSRTPARALSPAPELGEHTCEVLAQFGVSNTEFEQLRAEGVI